MNNYRRFGASSATLLDVFLCQDGALERHQFPAPEIQHALFDRSKQLAQEGFGYEVIPFEHQERNGRDYGLNVLRLRDDIVPPAVLLNGIPIPPIGENTILPQPASVPHGPFAALVEKLDSFFEVCGPTGGSFRSQITYCGVCKDLRLVKMKEHKHCSLCNNPFIEQPEVDNNVRMPEFRIDSTGRPFVHHPST